MKEILAVVGTRPEAVKMAPVIRALIASDRLRPVVCLSGQHPRLAAEVLEAFGIVPDIELRVGDGVRDLAELAARLLPAITGALCETRPATLLVHGDTTTTLAAALAGFYEGVPVYHVEAGLRSFDLRRPFPEELNRVLVGRLAAFHYAPTPSAADHLAAEGVANDRILVTGNTVVDALALARTAAEDAPLPLCEAAIGDARLLLVTLHRRESFGAPFEGMCRALVEVVERRSDLVIVYPVHPNPAVAEPARRLLGGRPRIHLLPPEPYLAFVRLMARADLILTDSGGIQEEAPSLGKRVLVAREVTERPEGVAAGIIEVVGTAGPAIVEAVLRTLDTPPPTAPPANPYGDGRAAQRILSHLESTVAGSGE